MTLDLLLISDRDGTLIEFVDYLGRENNWKSQIKLNQPVVDSIKLLQELSKARTYVVTNQQGVARKYFTREIVEEINSIINRELIAQGVKMDGWNYCPDVDKKYASSRNPAELDQNYVKEKTKRKPSAEMVLELLNRDKLKLEDFSKRIVFGDAEDDQKLAENLGAHYIDVKNKSFEDMKKEFLAYIQN